MSSTSRSTTHFSSSSKSKLSLYFDYESNALIKKSPYSSSKDSSLLASYEGFSPWSKAPFSSYISCSDTF